MLTLPPLFTALQEELGLHLEAAKGPVDVLVIDESTSPLQTSWRYFPP